MNKKEILTNITGGFSPFQAMGEDWEWKQSDHFFYYRYKKTVIYEAVQERPEITEYLMGRGTQHPRRYNKIVDSGVSNTNRAHNTRVRKKKASAFCTSCKIAEVCKPGKCRSCQEKDRIIKEVVEKAREECENLVKKNRELDLQKQDGMQLLIDDKCRIIRQLLYERAASEKEAKRAKEKAEKEAKKAKEKAEKDAQKAKEKAEEEAKKRDKVEKTLMGMNRIQNLVEQFQTSIASSQANALKLENLFVESMLKLAGTNLSIPNHHLKIEMGKHIANCFTRYLQAEFNVSSRNKKQEDKKQEGFSNEFNDWFNSQQEFNLKKKQLVLKIPNAVVPLYKAACPEGFYSKKQLLELCLYPEKDLEFIWQELKPIKISEDEVVDFDCTHKDIAKLCQHFHKKSWIEVKKHIYYRAHKHIAYVHDILNTKIKFYYDDKRLFTDVYMEVSIARFLC